MTRFAVILASVCSAAVLPAQTPAPQADGPRFEVASVKPAAAGTTRDSFRPDPTRFRGTFSVTAAVAFAYRIEQSRIVDAPQWARDERYVINATTPPRKPGDIQAMMRQLLADRFGLQAHRERRPIAVYVLQFARSDRRFGPGLLRVERDCSRPASNQSGCSASYNQAHFHSRGQEWGLFVSSLDTRIVGRPIVDRTGLSGQFDIRLDWSPAVTGGPDVASSVSSLAPPDAPPVLFTALREQLGLKLEPNTAAMDVVVIDRVARPTPD